MATCIRHVHTTNQKCSQSDSSTQRIELTCYHYSMATYSNRFRDRNNDMAILEYMKKHLQAHFLEEHFDVFRMLDLPSNTIWRCETSASRRKRWTGERGAQLALEQIHHDGDVLLPVSFPLPLRFHLINLVLLVFLDFRGSCIIFRLRFNNTEERLASNSI